MSCLLKLFQRKKPQLHIPTARVQRPAHSERFEVAITLEGPLPERDFELGILELELQKKLSHAKKRSFLALTNSQYSYQKGDMKKYVHFLNEKKRHSEELERIGRRLSEVVTKRVDLQTVPPLQLPPPAKIETMLPVTYQLTENVPSCSPQKLVYSRPIGRPRSHLADCIPAAPPHLRGRP